MTTRRIAGYLRAMIVSWDWEHSSSLKTPVASPHSLRVLQTHACMTDQSFCLLMTIMT